MTTPLPVRLDRLASTPLALQLSDAVRRLALDGTLAPGDRLPSTRALAAELGVSRATVETAWDQLRAEGWIDGARGSGTWVTTGPESTVRPVTPRLPATPPRPLVPMDAGTPWRPAHAPRAVTAAWRRAWRTVADAVPPRGYDDPRGLPALREALAERIARTRGLDVAPDDVLVTSGTTQGLRHVLTALPHRPVGIEDPGYRAAVATVLASGRTVVDLPARAPLGDRSDLAGLSAVYVTPAHQHPLGHVMGAEERVRLLAAAMHADALVVEDDYDSEFRYDVAPVPALAAMAPGQVALLGTASKSVMPSLRLGWMVLPERLRPTVDAFRALTHDTPPWAVQAAFTSLLRDGYVDAVVRAARRTYAERAPRVVEALSSYAELAGPVAGMYATWLVEEERALRAWRAAEEAGFRVNLLSTYCRSSTLSGLVVGFAGPTDDELEQALEVLRRALG